MIKIRKNDLVKIEVGKDAGKEAKVLRVLPKEAKVLVEGVNMYKRHLRKMGQNEGTIINVAKPIAIGNIALVCPSCKKPTRAGFKVENGKKIRVCKKCQEEIK